MLFALETAGFGVIVIILRGIPEERPVWVHKVSDFPD